MFPAISDTIHWIQVFSVTHEYLVYPALYVLAFFEGHIVTIISGLLIRFGYLYTIPTAVAIILGNLTGDVVLYWIGYAWGEKFVLRWGARFGITDASIATANRFFAKYHSFILLGSKVTNGFGLAMAVLFTAGMTRIPFYRYMVLNIIGECVWTCLLLLLGFLFGHLYASINNIFGYVFITAFAAALIYGFIRLNRTMRAKIEKA